jgi:hypothetical protein
MKYIIAILISILFSAAVAQERDSRAELDIEGSPDATCIAPDNKLWIYGNSGNIYCTDSIGGNWRIVPLQPKRPDEGYFSNPNIENMHFFEGQTAIMTGYIRGNSEYGNKGYFFSENNGRTWTLKDMPASSWMYTSFSDGVRNVWLGGLEKQIFHSSDGGRNFQVKKVSMKSSDRIYSIFMLNETTGYLGTEYGEVLYTNDNWNSVRSIGSPFDAKLIDAKAEYSVLRIDRIAVWKNYLIVLQNGRSYYADTTTFQFRPFKDRFSLFAVKPTQGELFAFTHDYHLISFYTPDSTRTITELELRPSGIDFSNNKIVLWSYGGYYTVDRSGACSEQNLYTRDYKIPEPKVQVAVAGRTIGFTNAHLYEKDEKGQWYRINVLQYGPSAVKVETDSSVIFWSTGNNNYRYNLRTGVSEKITLEDPLKEFFRSPVQSLQIDYIRQGCFHYSHDTIRYELNDKGVLHSLPGSKPYTSLDADRLESILKKISVSTRKNQMEISDLKITDADKKAFLAAIKKEKRKNRTDESGPDLGFYEAAVNRLDSVPSTLLSLMFLEYERYYSTSSFDYRITISNKLGEEIELELTKHFSLPLMLLPLEIHYQGNHFLTLDPELSFFLADKQHETVVERGVFDKTNLIRGIADYLWRQENAKK